MATSAAWTFVVASFALALVLLGLALYFWGNK